MEVFWREGYQGASLALLGPAMGLLPGSIYATFGSKEALFREALGRYLGQVRRAAADSGLDGRALIEAWFEVHVTRSLGADGELGRGCLLLASAAEAPRLDAESAAVVRAELDALEQVLKRCVAKARRDAPRDDAPSPTATARLLVAALAGISAMSRAGATRRVLDDVARAAIATV